MRVNAFGLDIGTTSVRAAYISKENNGLKLEAIGVIGVDEKGLQSESLIDQQGLADQIKKLLESASITTQSANIALPESQVYTRIIEMPELSEQELNAALHWELEQYIPLPLDQVQNDWQILGKRSDGIRTVMDVLIVAAPLRVIEKYEKILDMAGLHAEGIETEIISLHRALSPLLNISEPSLIVHLGNTTTNVMIVSNGILQSMFSIGLGGQAVTRAVAMDLGIDFTKADEYKRAYGLSKEALDGKIGKALNPILESIAGDIKKAIFSYREKNPKNEVKQIILSGADALLPGIELYFTNMFNVQVMLGNAWRAYNVMNIPDQLVNEAPGFNTVTGLAIRDLV